MILEAGPEGLKKWHIKIFILYIYLQNTGTGTCSPERHNKLNIRASGFNWSVECRYGFRTAKRTKEKEKNAEFSCSVEMAGLFDIAEADLGWQRGQRKKKNAELLCFVELAVLFGRLEASSVAWKPFM